MTESTDNNLPATIDAQSIELIPTPARIDLKSIDDARLEMARVYREMRGNVIEAQQGTRLVYVLAAIGKLIELHELKQRIQDLEGKMNK